LLVNDSKRINASINTSDGGDADVLTNTIGSEDFLPDSDGSFDDHIKPIHGLEKGRTKRAPTNIKKNLPK